MTMYASRNPKITNKTAQVFLMLPFETFNTARFAQCNDKPFSENISM